MPQEFSIAETAAREVFLLRSKRLEEFALQNREILLRFWELQEEEREAVDDCYRISKNNVSVLK